MAQSGLPVPSPAGAVRAPFPVMKCLSQTQGPIVTHALNEGPQCLLQASGKVPKIQQRMGISRGQNHSSALLLLGRHCVFLLLRWCKSRASSDHCNSFTLEKTEQLGKHKKKNWEFDVQDLNPFILSC